MKVGDKIKFDGERHRYTIRACDGRFAIMSKPFNARKTYLYTIVDMGRKVRGPCNLVSGLPEDCDTQDGANICLKWLNGFDDESGHCKMDVSYRRNKSLTEGELERLRSIEGCDA